VRHWSELLQRVHAELERAARRSKLSKVRGLRLENWLEAK